MNNLKNELLKIIELESNWIHDELNNYIFEFRNNKKSVFTYNNKRLFTYNNLCMIQAKLLELEKILKEK